MIVFLQNLTPPLLLPLLLHPHRTLHLLHSLLVLPLPVLLIDLMEEQCYLSSLE